MESREQRIATLAATLKSSGIAKSDSQARMMAEDMIGVEEHVQKSYEVEHARAHEYLQTTKNLGTPRQTIKPEPTIETKSISDAPKLEQLYSSREPEDLKKQLKKTILPEYTDTNFGSKTLGQAFDHDTHNSALEAIKAQVSRKEFTSVDDIVPDHVVPKSMLHEDIEIEPSVLHKDIEIIHDMDEPVKTVDMAIEKSLKMQDDALLDIPVEQSEKSYEKNEDSETLKDSEVKQPKTPIDIKESDKPTVGQESAEPQLDAQKLIDMMEEDGKLEEHTREIKEKPKDVKPKEAYEENNIDLGNVFNFNRK